MASYVADVTHLSRPSLGRRGGGVNSDFTQDRLVYDRICRVPCGENGGQFCRKIVLKQKDRDKERFQAKPLKL
jgi:hypothetical protein